MNQYFSTDLNFRENIENVTFWTFSLFSDVKLKTLSFDMTTNVLKEWAIQSKSDLPHH